MNVTSDRDINSVSWFAVLTLVLGFWLSGSLLLDLVILPSLSAAGMMADAGFVSAGYLVFGIFNHIELLCAGLVLTGFLVLRAHQILPRRQEGWSITLSVILLLIAIISTYVLTPQMSGLGLQLNLFESRVVMSETMWKMQQGYWGLEIIKAAASATLLFWCYRYFTRLRWTRS